MSQPPVNIDTYLHTYEQLQQAVDELSDVQLKWKGNEKQWSITEVLAHLADHNIVVSFRIREVLAGSEARLPAFSQDSWVAGQLANEGNVAEILAVFRSLLIYNSLLFRRLKPEDWDKSGVNFKGETVALSAIIHAFVNHVQHHIGQIDRIKKGEHYSRKKVLIRRSEESDRDAVKEVLLDAYGQYAHTLPAARWEQYKDSILSSLHASTTKARLLAEFEGEVVGSVFLYDDSEAAYGAPELAIHNPIIRLLAVSKSARGLGVATELIRASAQLALEWGADTLHLHTSDMMDSAVRLYERLGFERALDKEFMNGDLLVKSYRLPLKETALLKV